MQHITIQFQQVARIMLLVKLIIHAALSNLLDSGPWWILMWDVPLFIQCNVWWHMQIHSPKLELRIDKNNNTWELWCNAQLIFIPYTSFIDCSSSGVIIAILAQIWCLDLMVLSAQVHFSTQILICDRNEACNTINKSKEIIYLKYAREVRAGRGTQGVAT